MDGAMATRQYDAPLPTIPQEDARSLDSGNTQSDISRTEMDTGVDVDGASAQAQAQAQAQKRKKTRRACNHCQKAHMPCDSGRPCARCIRKKLASTCRDGARKRAKYLGDVPPEAFSPVPPDQQGPQVRGPPQPQQQPLPPITGDLYDFGSRTANLEYSMISNILADTRSMSDLDSVLSESSDSGYMAVGGVQDHSLEMVHRWNSPEEIYENIRTPYPYPKQFHTLLAYLRSRFDREHLVRVAKAMAAYRPSFIATTQRLKEADLIFMEQCFQRTLLEFERIFAACGTPTVVWRRTGQIAAVSREFCQLTHWTADQLLSKPTFVVELMDDQSASDYFDVFSRLAFGDSRGATMTECVLLRPTGERLPTACTWTVKRDVFDIPMMIIGNFLPVFV